MSCGVTPGELLQIYPISKKTRQGLPLFKLTGRDKGVKDQEIVFSLEREEQVQNLRLLYLPGDRASLYRNYEHTIIIQSLMLSS
jgi:hypothetical protein